jgi:hypothetical protein
MDAKADSAGSGDSSVVSGSTIGGTPPSTAGACPMAFHGWYVWHVENLPSMDVDDKIGAIEWLVGDPVHASL